MEAAKLLISCRTAELLDRESPHHFRECPCGEVFDMHGPEAVLMHVPHITETTSTRLEGAERPMGGTAPRLGTTPRGTVQATGT